MRRQNGFDSTQNFQFSDSIAELIGSSIEKINEKKCIGKEFIQKKEISKYKKLLCFAFA